MFPQEANLFLAPVHYDDYYKKRISFFDTLVDGVVIKSLKHAAIGIFIILYYYYYIIIFLLFTLFNCFFNCIFFFY